MTDTGRGVEMAGAIEQALVRRGAIGGGFMSRMRSFEHHLPKDIWPAANRIHRQRNRLAHGETKYLDNLNAFVRDCQRVLAAVEAIPPNAVPRPSLGRRIWGARPKLRKPRGQGSAPRAPQTAPARPPQARAPQAAPARSPHARARQPSAPKLRRAPPSTFGVRGIIGWVSVLVIIACIGVLRSRAERQEPGRAGVVRALPGTSAAVETLSLEAPTRRTPAASVVAAADVKREAPPAKPPSPKPVKRAVPAPKAGDLAGAPAAQQGTETGVVRAASADPAPDHAAKATSNSQGKLDLTTRALDEF